MASFISDRPHYGVTTNGQDNTERYVNYYPIVVQFDMLVSWLLLFYFHAPWVFCSSISSIFSSFYFPDGLPPVYDSLYDSDYF